jgi:hypothetical protein
MIEYCQLSTQFQPQFKITIFTFDQNKANESHQVQGKDIKKSAEGFAHEKGQYT